MMQRVLSLYILLAVAILTGCDGGSMPEELRAVDSMADSHPDSALICLDRLAGQKDSWDKASRMRYELLKAKAQNKAYIPFTSDSIATIFTDYYDSHGTPNDRLLAHYLLGCVYRDRGESPRAVDCFKDAIATADTTAEDCDYRTLGAAYAQMAYVYHRQLLLTYEIEARRHASDYAYLAKDTFTAIYGQELVAGAYILLNQNKKAEDILKKTMALFKKHGYEKAAARSSNIMMALYVDDKEKLTELKRLIDIYEQESGLFDEHHELPPNKRQFYYYKGKYYEGIGHLDSAEYYYRKRYYPDMPPVAKDPMYRGLLSVFKKRHQADSIAKYAQLFCEANDSSIAIKDRELTAQMAASYNYFNFEKEAHKNALKAYRFLVGLILSVCIIIILSAVGYMASKHYRKVQKLKQKEHQQELSTISAMLAESKRKSNELRQKYELSEKKIEKINTQHKSEKDKLTEQISILKNTVEVTQRRSELSDQLKQSQLFKETGIMKRIKIFLNHPQRHLSDSDLKLLAETTKEFYPDLMNDISQTIGTDTLGEYVCILVALKISSAGITHLLDITSSQVSNLKQEINTAMFHEKTARTLYTNLSQRYGISGF